MKFDVSGNIDFSNPTITLPPGTPPQLAGTIDLLAAGVNSQALYDRGVNSDITLPQIANFSMLYRMNNRWEVMADAQFTGWSSIPELRFNTSFAAGAAGRSAAVGRHLEVCAGRQLPAQRQMEGPLRCGVRPDAGHLRPDGATAGLRSLVAGAGRRIQVFAKPEVRCRLRLHFRRQPELQPEPGKHGGQCPGQRNFRCEHDHLLAAR